LWRAAHPAPAESWSAPVPGAGPAAAGHADPHARTRPLMPRFAGAAASHPGRVLLQNESSRERCEVLPGCVAVSGDGRYSHPRRVLLQKGLAAAAVGAPAPGAKGLSREHQLVRGVTGCSTPALRLQEPGPAGALSSSGRSTTPPPLSRW